MSTVWTGPPTCKMQGSMIIKEAFTIRLTDNSDGSDDLVLAAGTEFDSVDEFLSTWQTSINANGWATSYTLAVNTSGADKGKIKISNSTGHTFSINWDQAGDATEAARVRDWLGHAADVVNTSEPLTLTNAHKAGFYPALAPSALSRTSTGYGRGQGTLLSTASFTQSDPVRNSAGNVALELTLQLDCSTDWSELFDLADFFDDVFDYMGEPFSIINVPTDDTSGDYYTGYVVGDPFEFYGERVAESWNKLLTVSINMDASHAPHYEAPESGGGGEGFGGG